MRKLGYTLSLQLHVPSCLKVCCGFDVVGEAPAVLGIGFPFEEG